VSYRRRRCGRETRACFVQRLHGVRIELRPHVRAVSPPNWEVEAVRSVRARLRSRQWTVGCLRALPRKESETGEGGAAVSELSDKVIDVLAACGTDRVFENHMAVSVAIRTGELFRQPKGPDEKWVLRNGATMSEAGMAAAVAFSQLVRAESIRLREWADRIDMKAKR
jgi:hypothetical protein